MLHFKKCICIDRVNFISVMTEFLKKLSQELVIFFNTMLITFIYCSVIWDTFCRISTQSLYNLCVIYLHHLFFSFLYFIFFNDLRCIFDSSKQYFSNIFVCLWYIMFAIVDSDMNSDSACGWKNI